MRPTQEVSALDVLGHLYKPVVVLGIDPSMTRTAFTLCCWETRAGNADVAFTAKGHVLGRSSYEPPRVEAGLLWFRVCEAVAHISAHVADWSRTVESVCGRKLDAIVMEDPADQSQIGRGEYRSPVSIAVLAALMGALYPKAVGWLSNGRADTVALVPAGVWLPRTGGRGRMHPMSVDQRERFLLGEFHSGSFPLGKRGGKDHDVLAAAGVARWWALRRWAANPGEQLMALQYSISVPVAE